MLRQTVDILRGYHWQTKNERIVTSRQSTAAAAAAYMSIYIHTQQ